MALFGVAFVEFALAFGALLLAIFYFRNKKDPRYPPGPRALPLIGNLLQLSTKPQETLWRWAEEYGPIFSFKMGSEDVIMLSDYKIIKDVFQEAAASGRTKNPVFLAIGDGNNGVVMSEGSQLDQQRRFLIRKLKDLGLSKTGLSIVEDANSMIRWFEKRLDQPISGNRIFNGAVLNVLWHIISGEASEWDTSEPPEMITNASNFVISLNRAVETGLMFAPSLRYIAPGYSGWNGVIESVASLMKIGDISVARHSQELDYDNPQDFIDHYLTEQKRTKDPSSSFYKEKGDKNLRAVITDLFLGGSETTSNTLSWVMLLLAHHQTVQKKMQQELDTVIGQSRQPMLSDRPNLPFTEAVILEVSRMASVANNGVPHRMLDDAMFHGYFFPKNTTVMANIYKVHHDPKVWGDPENFRPERFLSPDGLKVIKHEALMPFSVGKRQCIGYSLANDTLSLFTAALFQKFNVKLDPSEDWDVVGKTFPSTKMVNEPEPFKIIVSLR